MKNEEYFKDVEKILEDIEVLCKKGNGAQRALQLRTNCLENRIPSIDVDWYTLRDRIERHFKEDKKRWG